jgi:hypothetical protein
VLLLRQVNVYGCADVHSVINSSVAIAVKAGLLNGRSWHTHRETLREDVGVGVLPVGPRCK